jgi:hypothetical protein
MATEKQIKYMRNLELKIADIQELNIHEMKTQNGNGSCTIEEFKHLESRYYATGATDQNLRKEMIKYLKYLIWKPHPLRSQSL